MLPIRRHAIISFDFFAAGAFARFSYAASFVCFHYADAAAKIFSLDAAYFDAIFTCLRATLLFITRATFECCHADDATMPLITMLFRRHDAAD